jgi:hypothetical protein
MKKEMLTEFLLKKLKEREHSEDLGIGRKIILKRRLGN